MVHTKLREGQGTANMQCLSCICSCCHAVLTLQQAAAQASLLAMAAQTYSHAHCPCRSSACRPSTVAGQHNDVLREPAAAA